MSLCASSSVLASANLANVNATKEDVDQRTKKKWSKQMTYIK